MVNLTPAAVQDAKGAEAIIKTIGQRWPWLKRLFADGAYHRGKPMSEAAFRDFLIEIARKLAGQQGFRVPPRRWLAARSCGSMTRWRRLVRDYEERVMYPRPDPCQHGRLAAAPHQPPMTILIRDLS